MIKNNKLKILIVEDEEVAREYLSILLEDRAEELYYAVNGLNAIEIYKENKGIDLILMDIKMPVMNGYDASRKIRELNKDVIIIAQTAFALKGDREKAIEAGCNDYITKPINKNDLLTIIEKHLI